MRYDPIWFLKEKLGWNTIYPMQEKVIRTFYQHKYDPELPEYKKLIARIGQRAGKTVTGSKIAVYEFFELASLPTNPSEHFGLMKNQPIGINCVAAGKEQAMDGIFSLMRDDIESNDWFNQWYDIKVTEGRIDIESKNIYAKVSAAKADTGAGTGATSKAIFGDEVDLWQRTDSKLGAELVWSKLINSTQTLGNAGKCIAISSTQYPDGMITRLYRAGLKEKTTLVYNLPTWEFNPKMSREVLEEEYKYKMEYFWRDFANQPNVSGGLQFPEKVKFNRNIQNVLQMDFSTITNSISRYNHILAIDPAYKNDSFGVACGFMVGDRIIVDGAAKIQKTNSEEEYILPSDIRNFIVGAINSLNVSTFIYDVFITPELTSNHSWWHPKTIPNFNC